MIKELYNYFLIKRSRLFDPVFYLKDNPDVRRADVDPLWHYIIEGWKEGRSPSPDFDTRFYLNNYQDVFEAGINPLIHYIKFGIHENRLTNQNLINVIDDPIEHLGKNQLSMTDEEMWHKINESPLSEKVDIIICVGPNPDNITPCLSSIRKHTKNQSYNLHLVVHKKDLKSISSINTSDSILHIHEMVSFNFARANNIVMGQSENDVVLLNDDTEVTQGWLTKLQKASKGVALTGAHTGIGCSGNPDTYGTPEIKLTDYPVNMYCAFIPRRVRQVVGLLDEEFVYYGGEDVDYAIRARINGFPLIISDAFVVHKNNQSFKDTKVELIKESDKFIKDKYGIDSPFNLSQVRPKVSVVMATRNRPELLESAIDTVQLQYYKNYELIIVDDYSTRDTNSVILEKQNQFNNIINIRLSKNVGAANARMIGLRAATGQFVLITDDDDTVLPNRILKPLEHILMHPYLDVVYCNYNVINNQGGPFPIYCQEFNYQAYLEREFYIGLGVLFARKNVFLDVPLNTRFNTAGDYDWVFRILRKGYRIDLCPEIVMNYNRIGTREAHLSITSDSIKKHKEVYKREQLLEKLKRVSSDIE